MKEIKIFGLLMFLFLISCEEIQKDDLLNSKKNKITHKAKEFSNDNFNIKVKIQGENLTFEIKNKFLKNKINAISDFGEVNFTSYSPIISYLGDSIKVVDNLFYKNEFFLLPVEDWKGNQIFYKIPLMSAKSSDTIHPFFILKEQYCIFNIRNGVIFSHEKIKNEFFIDSESYYLSNLSLRYSYFNKKQDNITISFCTQKEINISENTNPNDFKSALLKSIKVFLDNQIYDAFFK